MLVFIYHLKTSFEQGHLREEKLFRYRYTFFNASVEIVPTSSNRRLIFSLVLKTEQLLIIYILHLVIISWYKCNNSKNIYICKMHSLIVLILRSKQIKDYFFLT